LFAQLAIAVGFMSPLLCLSLPARAQPSSEPSATSEQRIDQLTEQVEELRSLVLKLENRVEALQAASRRGRLHHRHDRPGGCVSGRLDDRPHPLNTSARK